MCPDNMAGFSRKAQSPGGAGGDRVRCRKLPCLTLLGDMDTNPGNFISWFLSSSLPGTPLSSHHGTSKRLWKDTMIMEAAEISAQD